MKGKSTRVPRYWSTTEGGFSSASSSPTGLVVAGLGALLDIFSTICDELQSLAKPARHLVMQMQIFCVYGPYKESISKEINNDLMI